MPNYAEHFFMKVLNSKDNNEAVTHIRFKELAVDLGAANTLIMQDDKVVVDEPSIIAIDKKTERS
ncbi:MAG: rod shape-determining protein [Saprospiraceae bacterium]